MSHQISLLIDTNVWMDYYDASRTGSKAAFELINNALEHGAELVYTVPSSKDVFYLIGRAYKGCSALLIKNAHPRIWQP